MIEYTKGETNIYLYHINVVVATLILEQILCVHVVSWPWSLTRLHPVWE